MKKESANSYQFSGHETFPLRQLWLMKAVDYTNLKLRNSQGETSAVFAGEAAMSSLGVGKNMVSSILYWARASGFIEENTTRPTELGQMIFGDYRTGVALDPYNESITTAWLVHWNLCSVSDKCTAFWYIFNYVTTMDFSRSDLVDSIEDFLVRQEAKTSIMTVRRAVEVCLRSYVPNFSCRSKALSEEFVEPLLGGLGMMQVKSRDVVSMKRMPRSSLHPALFAYCLLDYWEKHGRQSSSMEFGQLLHNVGSPGKVFRVDENSLVDYLDKVETLTEGSILWTDQAGIRSLIFRKKALSDTKGLKFELLRKAYQEE